MIELGELFNRCIPMDTLLRMPRKFVSRLRELRRFQKKRQMEQHNQQMASMNASQYGGSTNHAASIQNAQNVLNSTAIDELVDELS